MVNPLAASTRTVPATRHRAGNIAMLHIGRCGSTVLANLLRQDDRVYWDGEIYKDTLMRWTKANRGREVPGQWAEDPITMIQHRMSQGWQLYYGFEVKPFQIHITGRQVSEYVDILRSYGFAHFVILDRKNRLRKIISSIIARHRNKWHRRVGQTVTQDSVYIDTGNIEIDFEAKPLLDFLKDYDRQMNELNQIMKGQSVLHLTYEDDIQNDPRLGYRRICDFLGIQPQRVSVSYVRTNPFPINALLRNHHMVAKALRDTPYEWMLHD